MIRHVTPASTIRSSWHRTPIVGIGRECGIDSALPCCSSRRRYPAWIRAALPKGGVLTSPCSQAIGLSSWATSICYVSTDIARKNRREVSLGMPRRTAKTTSRHPKGARAPKPAEADGASSSDRAGRRPPKTRPNQADILAAHFSPLTGTHDAPRCGRPPAWAASASARPAAISIDPLRTSRRWRRHHEIKDLRQGSGPDPSRASDQDRRSCGPVRAPHRPALACVIPRPDSLEPHRPRSRRQSRIEPLRRSSIAVKQRRRSIPSQGRTRSISASWLASRPSHSPGASRRPLPGEKSISRRPPEPLMNSPG